MTSYQFRDDRPVESADEDKLGFDAFAKHIAKAILEYSPSGGFVIGLEGEWGSGKTSLTNLIAATLRKASGAPEIVKFSPWLIKSRDGLLVELFDEIARAAERIDIIDMSSAPEGLKGSMKKLLPFLFWPSPRNASRERLRRSMRSFFAHLATMGTFVEIAGNAGVPYASTFGRTMREAGHAGKSLGTGEHLDSEKKKLMAELRKLERQIVIFVDDLDRLEPRDAAEMVRLVRAVADFPKVTYVLCYSRKVLASSLRRALEVEDGDEYINKIIQVAFSIPQCEGFDLRRMFREGLLEIFPPNVQSATMSEASQRLASVIDKEGGRALRTPRDVNRSLNALRLYAGPIIDKIDLADMVWLQLMRRKKPLLYKWVESYVNDVSALYMGAHISDDGKSAIADELVKAVDARKNQLASAIHELRAILPGISVLGAGNADHAAQPLIFQDINRNTIGSYVENKRLGSPEHFRYYFALSKPSGAIDDSEFQAFLGDCAHNESAAIEKLVRWSRESRPQGGVMAEAALDRLASNMPSATDVSSGILPCLANAMDIAAQTCGRGYWGVFWVWNTADHIFRAALKRVEPQQRPMVVSHIFRDGMALGWLSNIFRRERFDRSRKEGNQLAAESCVLTVEEIDAIKEMLKTRYRELPPGELLRVPDFLNLLLGWYEMDADCEQEVRRWVSERTNDDKDMLEFLDGSRSWAAINDKVIFPINERDLKDVLDFQVVRARVGALARHEDTAIRRQAEAILDAMREGGELPRR